MKFDKKFWVEVAIFVFFAILVIWAGRGLFKYSFYQTHDLVRQLVRGYDAVLTIREGHFPLRWAGLTNYACGVPTYNFYYPLFYYLIIAVNFFSGGVMLPIKIISLLSLAFGTIFFYLWIKEETGNRSAAVSSAVLYLLAPYRFSLIYVRGDPEYLSYALLPIVLYFFAKMFNSKDRYSFMVSAFWAAISGGFLAISHNVVSVFVFPIIFFYLLAKIIKNKIDKKKIVVILLAFLSAFGIGAFFIFPAVLEIRYTQIAHPIFNYKDHFPAFWQLLYSKWGFGDSAIGTKLDGLSFQLGLAQWIVLGVVILWLIFNFLRKVSYKWVTEKVLILYFLAISILTIYLMLSVSIPVWEISGISRILDFPWRLLGISVFSVSALLGFWLSEIKSTRIVTYITIAVCLFAIIGNRNYLLSQPVLENDIPFYKSLDTFSAAKQSVPAFAENILPPGAKPSCYLTTPVVSTDVKDEKITFTEVSRGSTFGSVNLDINKQDLRGDKIIINLGYFPDMFDFTLNGKKYSFMGCNGLTCIGVSDLVNGSNQISWRVKQTRVEQVFNIVSVLFIVAWVYIIIKALRNNAKK